MDSSRPKKRPPVPILLESFPVPPTHIPPTPATTSPNPPPTGPPSVPLPPVPGPSRISEHEQILLLSSISNRSRRSSRYSSSSRRESVVSLNSAGHGGNNQHRMSVTNPSSNRDSIASQSSRSSPRVPPQSFPDISSSPPPTKTRHAPQLTRISMPQLSDIEDDDETGPSGPIPHSPTAYRLSSHRRRHHLHAANESLTEIDFRDILGAQMLDDEHPDLPVIPQHSSAASAQLRRLSSISTSHRTTPSVSSTATTAKHPRSPTMTNFAYPPSSLHSPTHHGFTSISSASPSSSTTTLVQREKPPPGPASPRRLGSIPSLSLSSNGAYSPPSSTPTSPAREDHVHSIQPSLSTMTQFSVASSSSTSSELTSLDGSTPASSFGDVSPVLNSPELMTMTPSFTMRDLRRMEKTKSQRMEHALGTLRARFGKSEGEEQQQVLDEGESLLSGILVTKTTKVIVEDALDGASGRGKGTEEMSVDEFGMMGAVRHEDEEGAFPKTPSRRLDLAWPTTTTKSDSSRAKVKPQDDGKKEDTQDDPRTPSPDIASILSRTPRPSLGKSVNGKTATSSRSLSEKASTRSLGRPRFSSASAPGGPASTSGNVRRGIIRRRVSEGPVGTRSTQAREGGGEDDPLERVLNDVGSGDEHGDGDRLGEERGRGDGDGDDSDSSLDLHTPLPHLMVRHGLLSPNSKLLPGAASRAATPLDGRPGSVISNVSVMTKSGVIKDERDTPMRRFRHRDGRLLRGGIGLTTGLGWSDSEDEDAPSPLTRRLSTLNLARRSSASSILTTGNTASLRLHQQQHPLSRSYSSGALLESDHHSGSRGFDADEDYDDDDLLLDDGEEDNTLQESGEWARRMRKHSGMRVALSASVGARQAIPPTSWTHRQGGARMSGGSVGGRTSTSSVGSTFSLEVTIPEDGPEAERPSSTSSTTASRMKRSNGRSSLGSSMGGGARDSSGSSSLDPPTNYHRPTLTKRPSGDEVNTPTSTASTLSIPMPVTPLDYDPLSGTVTMTKGSVLGYGGKFDKEKSLPPLPTGGLRKPSSITNLRANATSNTANAKSTSTSNAKSTSSTGRKTPSDGAIYTFPRARTFSSTSSASASSVRLGAVEAVPPTPVRPLQLPRQTPLRGDRAAVPVPSISALSSSALRSAPRTPSLTSARLAAAAAAGSSSPYDGMPASPGPGANLNYNSTPVTVGTARPRPRTGTGMVYRTSVGKMPMVLASSISTGVGGGGAGAGSIGRSGGRPIVL